MLLNKSLPVSMRKPQVVYQMAFMNPMHINGC